VFKIRKLARNTSIISTLILIPTTQQRLNSWAKFKFCSKSSVRFSSV